MRNYTLTPINSENTWISWSQQFLLPLANDTKSLYDYWLYFSPNYEEINYNILKNNYRKNDKGENLAINELLINALNYRQYVYIKENNIKASFGEDIDLPAGTIVISNVMPIGNNDAGNLERQKIENYIIQYSSSADYYVYSIERHDNNEYSLVAKYVPNAGEIHGNQLLLQVPSYFPRFCMIKKPWTRNASGMTFAAYNYNPETKEVTNQIVDKNGLVWQLSLPLSNYNFIETNVKEENNTYSKVEEIILDTTHNSYLNKVDNHAIPSYNIVMQDNVRINLNSNVEHCIYTTFY